MTGEAAAGSLRFRLLAGAAVWIVLALAVAGAVLTGLFRAHVERRIEAELVVHLDQLAAALELAPEGGGAPSLAREPSDPRFRKPYSGLYWQVNRGGAKEPALRSRSLWDVALRPSPDTLADGEVHRHRLAGPDGQTLIALERTILLPDAAAGYRLVAAADQAELAAATAAFARPLALSLAVLALALVAAAAVQVEVGLRPLRGLRDGLAAVRAGRAGRLEGRFPSEVRPLVDDLNALLAHAEAVTARARAQAGNLAHALKTPLSILANEAAALEAGGGATATAPPPGLADTLRQQLALMRRHVDHHLARARAAAAAAVPGARVPVRPSAAALARALARLHAERGVEITLAIPPDHVVRGERQDLDEMLGNLMDNACKWARNRVEVASRREGDRLVVTVDDDGPGLPPERREAAFAPGARLDESVPGTGLGLAIVRDLAELHGGAVALTASPLGGLRAELMLPAA